MEKAKTKYGTPLTNFDELVRRVVIVAGERGAFHRRMAKKMFDAGGMTDGHSEAAEQWERLAGAADEVLLNRLAFGEREVRRIIKPSMLTGERMPEAPW